jgi:hypothetical protein
MRNFVQLGAIGSPAVESPSGPPAHKPLPLVRAEADLLPLALEVAARAGEPDPELIQHVCGSREEVTKTTGSWVHSDEPSYLIAIRGNFTARRPVSPTTERQGRQAESRSYSVQVLVFDVKTGRITDSGGSGEYPGLSAVGPVVTDYRRPS